MNGFIVHGIPGSPFSRAVLATLEEKGADYRLEGCQDRAAEGAAWNAVDDEPVHDASSIEEWASA